VQISLDEELLEAIDRHEETRKRGRSALIRRALRLYFDLERRRDIDVAYARAYGNKADEVWDDFAKLMDGQAWPDE
jgi:metal-responsive CopG/Arc/MetJ family transcriptional regulator